MVYIQIVVRVTNSIYAKNSFASTGGTMDGMGNITSKCYWFEHKIDLKIYVLFESPYQQFYFHFKNSFTVTAATAI